MRHFLSELVFGRCVPVGTVHSRGPYPSQLWHRCGREEPGSWYADLEYAHTYSLSWHAAALALATTKAERVTACMAHLARMKELEKDVEKVYRAGRINERSYLATRFFRAKAEIFVSEAKAQ